MSGDREIGRVEWDGDVRRWVFEFSDPELTAVKVKRLPENEVAVVFVCHYPPLLDDHYELEVVIPQATFARLAKVVEKEAKQRRIE